jgi:hypothetical protein
MSSLLLRRAARSGSGPAAALHARLFASSGPEPGANDGSKAPEGAYDAAEAGLPVRLHQLIGDPRTGVADDTTQPLYGDLSIEWIWHQNTTGVNWYRYALAGRDQLPNMHMDVRLSDHSRNLIYLLRCKDPQRWARRGGAGRRGGTRGCARPPVNGRVDLGRRGRPARQPRAAISAPSPGAPTALKPRPCDPSPQVDHRGARVQIPHPPPARARHPRAQGGRGAGHGGRQAHGGALPVRAARAPR